jgi:hypothetical protein
MLPGTGVGLYIYRCGRGRERVVAAGKFELKFVSGSLYSRPPYEKATALYPLNVGEKRSNGVYEYSISTLVEVLYY